MNPKTPASKLPEHPQSESPVMTYHRDLEKLIREYEERATLQAQQRMKESRPTRLPYGFD